jgi:uncharacterized radical SAM superfamily protein
VFFQLEITMQPSAEKLWRLNEKEFLNLINAGTLTPAPKIVHFYAPSFAHYKTSYYSCSQTLFPTISITGTSCALNCRHCEGKVLQTMHPATNPKTLFALAKKLKHNGALGCLVSGGCLSDGSVPLKLFIPIIKKIKQELGLTVFVHTGIINVATAKRLKAAGIDAALIDIIGSDETITKIGNLNLEAKNYANSLRALQKTDLNYVPHVIVGLDDGKLKGEFDALNMIAAVEPAAIVVIALMPIHGTAMADVKPPKPSDIVRVVANARLMFPKTPLVLGCMRPKGKLRDETDVLALKAGVNAIAFPSEEAIKYAKEQGYELIFSSFCCAQIYCDSMFRSASK